MVYISVPREILNISVCFLAQYSQASVKTLGCIARADKTSIQNFNKLSVLPVAHRESIESLG